MTNGIAVILGPVGHNFAAGMTGGMAYVYDADESFSNHVNDDTVMYQRIQVPYWEKVLKKAVECWKCCATPAPAPCGASRAR